jgi:predicted aspartyl protease
VSVKSGPLKLGHPYVNVSVSADGKTGQTYEALIDTGYSGFVSLPSMAASILGLKTHTTARYVLANGKQSDPIPLAYGYACLEGERYLRGLIAISEHSRTVIGMEFLSAAGKALVLASGGLIIIDEKEFLELLEKAARAKNEM